MTPKEKAKELVSKFMPYTPAEAEYEFEIGKLEFKQNGLSVTAAPSHELVKGCAKKHALIAVDLRLDGYFVFIGIEYGEDSIEYWQQVKQEIENL